MATSTSPIVNYFIPSFYDEFQAESLKLVQAMFGDIASYSEKGGIIREIDFKDPQWFEGSCISSPYYHERARERKWSGTPIVGVSELGSWKKKVLSEDLFVGLDEAYALPGEEGLRVRLFGGRLWSYYVDYHHTIGVVLKSRKEVMGLVSELAPLVVCSKTGLQVTLRDIFESLSAAYFARI